MEEVESNVCEKGVVFMNLVLIWKKPHLLWLWFSQLLSVVGDHLFTVALTWMAVQKAGSSAALVTAAGLGTAMLLGLFGGALADRWNRHLTMVSTDWLRALIVGMLPVIDTFGELQLWHFVIVVVLVEGLGTLFDPAMQASLPKLCGGDPLTLQTANALMDGTHRLARVLGPGLTGWFLLVLSLPEFFAADAVTFAVSAVVLLALKSKFPTSSFSSSVCSPARSAADRVPRKRSLFTEIGDSLRLLGKHKALLWALTSLGIVNIAWSAVYFTGIPLLVDQQLAVNVGAYGLIIGAYGIGNLVSLFVMSLLPFRMNLIMMFVGQLLLALGFLLLGTAETLWMAMFATALAAFGSPMGDLIMLQMIQTDFPSEHIGKIYSLRRMISMTGLLLGSLAAVVAFKWLSVALSIQLFSCLILLSGIAGVIRFSSRANKSCHALES